MVRVPGCWTGMFCVSCEVRIEFIYMLCRRKYTASVVWWREFLNTEWRCIVLPMRYELNLCMFCRRESRLPLWSSGQASWLLNGDVLCFLWGTNWICVCYVEESRPPLWSSGQSSCSQTQRSGFDSRNYQIFWEVMGLERGPLSLLSTIEELLGIKRSCSGLENRDYGRRGFAALTSRHPSIR
jgi:hypothetical protein